MTSPLNRSHSPPPTTDALGYDIFRCTAALIFLLEGMESVRAMRAPPSATEPERVYPVLAEIDLALILEAPGHGAGRLLGPGAEVEQLAYRGWIERLATRAEPEGRRAKEVWSDLRAMRADLLNNQGVASANRSGGCTVLTWFRAGEPIRFSVRHVLDLFNQLGLLSLRVRPEASNLAARWTLLTHFDPDPATGVPQIVSLRQAIASGAPGGPDHAPSLSAGCVVFADGVFAELSPADANGARLDDQGDLRLADGSVVARARLYRDAVAALNTHLPSH